MKTPDCVAWQHEGGERIYPETKDLSPEELAAWWDGRNRELAEYIARLRTERARAATPVGEAQ